MAYFKIAEPDKKVKYIKKVNAEKGIITFQDSTYDAYYKSDCYYADAEMDYLKFHFMEKYPELKYMTKCSY